MAHENNNKGTAEKTVASIQLSDSRRFTEWTNFQGKEDAELLSEKHIFRAQFRSQKDYERIYDDE